MTCYATLADVETRYGDVLYGMAGRTDDGLLNADAVCAALDEAAAEIDAVLATAARSPDRRSPVLRRICIDIAVGGLGRTGAERADVYERRAADARKLLASLTGTGDGGSAPAAPGGGVEFSPAIDGIFADMKGF